MFIPFKNWRGEYVGNYKIIERLGEGRYGISYLATTNRGEHVVIKRFKPHIFKRNKQKNAYEAVILSQINHSAVPKLLGVINEKDFTDLCLNKSQALPLKPCCLNKSIFLKNRKYST